MSEVPPFDPVDRPLASGEDTAEVPPVPSSTAESPAWHTTELATRHGAILPPGLWLVFVFVAAVGLLLGIAVAASTRPRSPGAVVATATIGPDGGALSFGTHGLVRIPDGAVSAPVRIEVRRSVVKDRLRVAPPDGPLYVFEPNRLVAFTFAPSSVTFARPVTIVLPLNATGRGGTAFIDADNRILFLPGKVDPKAGTVTITVNDFRFGGGAGA